MTCVDAADEVGGNPVGEIVDALDAATARENLSLEIMLEEIGTSSFLPALMVPALLVVSPLSGIPLFSTFCGLLIAFIAGQMLIARHHLWLPDRLMRMRINPDRARAALRKVRIVTDWLDRVSRHRLTVLTARPFNKVLHLLCMCCGLAMPFLELVPFSSSLLGGAVTLLATALLARDGLFALVGSAAIVGAALLPLTLLGVV